MAVIHLSHEAEVKLTAWTIATMGLEFSGLGLVERVGKDFLIVDVDLLGVGSYGYTEFSSDTQRALAPDPRRKLWFHRHPLGDGNPGPHNWSGRDEQTATREPLGGIPQLVGWSLSIVRTPGGWVGRADFYVPTLKTFHLEVSPSMPSVDLIEEAKQLIDGELHIQIDTMLEQYRSLMAQNLRSYRPDDRANLGEWEPEDFDLYDEEFYLEEIEGLDEDIWPLIAEPEKQVKPWWRLF